MVTRIRRIFAAAMTLSLASLILGCNRGPALPANLPPLTACTLQIQYKQTPVTEATVTLIPAHGDWVGVARTDATGKAVVQTQGRYDGVPAGDYSITVTKYEPVTDLPPDPATPEEDAASTLSASHQSKRKSLVPEKYTKPETTDLKLTITDLPVEQTLQLSE
ncbi:carboxypeptidase-like regulatory domain-containing protein [Blastopirellula sp. J2-11]|uniref:carboxypeptidase-like regulatory domain-containing protein n=1 Tax=Blastopirellula sp. J2-11 TaxID=2943192 RepID=UPI0021C74240|nr:carboxypeptidase-like regulatory domain-containing protein [Blastopirellula sp. J2-11]UUO08853.1 carboxypeptidase-like regulatory domain-containing protein [Blastopirellula sp. J2-11]